MLTWIVRLLYPFAFIAIILLSSDTWKPFSFTLLGVLSALVWAAVEWGDSQARVSAPVSRGMSRIVFASFVGLAALASSWPHHASSNLVSSTYSR